ncbi:hypothetical protein COCNU_scaffold004798G000010 [Cocos nucifera]|nr:hypothetical protein [Cocos nucifera]
MNGSILSYIVEKMMGHYLFAHSKAVDLHQVEASKTLQEESSQKVEEVSMGLRAALTLSKDKRKKAEEEVSIERERAVEAFKSSRAMEDIKIAFAQEAFLEGFEIYMRRVVKNFPRVDLDFLTNKPNGEADPSNIGAASPATEPTLGVPELTAEAPKSILEPKAAKDVPTSPVHTLTWVENL